MNLKHSLVILLIFLVGCTSREESPTVDMGELPVNEMEFQKMVMAQLTGEKPIITSTGEKLHLPSRWEESERKIVRGYLAALFEKLELPVYQHQYEMPNPNFGIDLLLEPLKGTNMYTILPATNDSNEYIVVGAHYDTDGNNFPGAIDNGSGVTLISTLLRRVKKLKVRNKSLLVVYFDQEEENISAGSIAFARFLKTQNYRVHSVHSYDLIGWDGDNNREIQLEQPSAEIENVYRRHADSLNIPMFVFNAESSDYYSFVKEGINAVGISQAYAKGDVSGKKDSPEDKYHLVNFEFLASSTNLAFEVIKDLLND
ncbi:MAG: M28 family peptidase [Bacteroidota bacterium]